MFCGAVSLLRRSCRLNGWILIRGIGWFGCQKKTAAPVSTFIKMGTRQMGRSWSSWRPQAFPPSIWKRARLRKWWMGEWIWSCSARRRVGLTMLRIALSTASISKLKRLWRLDHCLRTDRLRASMQTKRCWREQSPSPQPHRLLQPTPHPAKLATTILAKARWWSAGLLSAVRWNCLRSTLKQVNVKHCTRPQIGWITFSSRPPIRACWCFVMKDRGTRWTASGPSALTAAR